MINNVRFELEILPFSFYLLELPIEFENSAFTVLQEHHYQKLLSTKTRRPSESTVAAVTYSPNSIAL